MLFCSALSQNLQGVALVSPRELAYPQQPGSDYNKKLQEITTKWYTMPTIVKSGNKHPTEMTILQSNNNTKAIKKVDKFHLIEKKENDQMRKQQEEEEKEGRMKKRLNNLKQ
jgi:hypothetical protein